MNQTFTFRNLSIVLFLVISNYAFSQFTFINGGRPYKNIPEFNYNGNFYELNTNGMSKFLTETEISKDLNENLSNQLQRIKRKSCISSIVFGVAAVSSVGLFGYKVFGQKDNENNEKVGAKDFLLTAGIMSLGIATSLIIKPKKRDYKQFFDTFNSKSSKKPIEIGLKINHNENINFGLVLNF